MSQRDGAAERSAHVTRGGERAAAESPVAEVAPGVFQLRAVAELEAQRDMLAAALRGLLADTQHRGHACSDADCPVAAAQAAVKDSPAPSSAERLAADRIATAMAPFLCVLPNCPQGGACPGCRHDAGRAGVAAVEAMAGAGLVIITAARAAALLEAARDG